ncbi:MAG: acetylglutamate kinase [Gammaproteobacteria bacterium]|nr:acetylglutamate kinase [Gammaproteobacteria bacterium]
MTMNRLPGEYAELLLQSLPYIRKFQNKTMVIKYGGNAMLDENLQASFAEDVVMLKLVGLNPIVVHGGGPQIDEALRRLGKKGIFIQGMRYTDSETMEVVEWVLGGRVQQHIVGLIDKFGGKAVGLTGRDGELFTARKLFMEVDQQAIDLGYVGVIDVVNTKVVQTLVQAGFIPVISPIGYGENNQSYNINADLVAGRIAMELRAEKLITLTNTAGVLDDSGHLMSHLTPQRIEDLVKSGVISDGMLPKLSGAIEAATQGVASVHIIDGRVPHSLLLEIMTDRPMGTMITRD